MRYNRLTFSRLIRRNEFRELVGWRYQTLIFLSAILFITFLCFGFSKSAYNLVKDLSRDPLSNWINIKFTGNSKFQLQRLDKEIAEEGHEKYLIKNSSFYSIFGMSFLDTAHALNSSFDVRTIDPNSPIVENLVNNKNLIKKFFDARISQCMNEIPEGIIVKEKMLQRLGFSVDATRYLFLPKPDGSMVIKLPIIAIVNDLPDGVSAIISDNLYCNWNSSRIAMKETSALEIYVERIDARTAIRIAKEIAPVFGFEDISYFSIDTLNVFPDSLVTYFIKVPDLGKDMSQMEKFSKIIGLPTLTGLQYGPYLKFELDSNCTSEGYFHDFLAVEFEKLDKIREFANYIDKEYKVSMNMETLIQRENYLFIGNLALAAIIMVIAFSVFSLTLYISETFKNHILKVKKNLGNLMALGASNNDLINLYMRVAFRMLLYAIIIAFVVGFISGELFEEYALGRLIVLQEDQNYFSLLNLWLVIFIVLIIAIAMAMTFVTIKRILKLSPGDLIYERDKTKKDRNPEIKEHM